MRSTRRNNIEEPLTESNTSSSERPMSHSPLGSHNSKMQRVGSSSLSSARVPCRVPTPRNLALVGSRSDEQLSSQTRLKLLHPLKLCGGEEAEHGILQIAAEHVKLPSSIIPSAAFCRTKPREVPSASFQRLSAPRSQTRA